MLPGLPERTIHLDGGARTVGRGVAGRRLRQCPGGPSVRGCNVRIGQPGRGRVGEAAGALDGNLVVGQRVLDSLECPDR